MRWIKLVAVVCAELGFAVLLGSLAHALAGADLFTVTLGVAVLIAWPVALLTYDWIGE